MNLENLPSHPFIFPAFKEIEKREQHRKLGPYTEISLEIFEKLGRKDIYQASLVCKEWKRLVEQTNLWKKLYSASFEVDSQEEKQASNDKEYLLKLSSCPWNKAQIAKFLWQDSTTIISDSIQAKVKAAAAYLQEEGFELKGVASDGDCFFSAFLGSYACLSRKIPLLEEWEDKIFYLRQVLSELIKHIDNERAEEIKRKAAWISGLGEGDRLALALSIPIRLITVNEEQLRCGIHDRVIFSGQGLGLLEENRSQEWKTILQQERPKEFIFIVDLGGHFVYAQKHLKQASTLFSNLRNFSNIPLSNFKSKNEFKKNLASLEIDDLLSEEKIKELELFYTQALKIAIHEQDLIQESFCIEKLGDIYLRKEMSETLLQAAGLYNYALRLAPRERQEIIKNRLSQAQNLLAKQCEGKPCDPAVNRGQFESNRNTLKNFREEIEKKIQILPENPSPQQVRELYQEVVRRIKGFFSFLVNQAIDVLGPAPCEYAMIGFGSLAREEMTPYSDLEFGLLIQEDTLVNKKYFKNLTNLLHLQVINLGETILPALNIPCLKAIGFFDGITPRGFAFDGAGVEGKGCKTPLGNGKTFELIQTPEKMAQYIAQDKNGKWWHEKEPHLPMELLTFTHLLGNLQLTKAYNEKIQEILNTNTYYQDNLDLRQYLAKQHLVLGDMIAFNPGMGDLDRHGMLFQVKNDFYRFPHLAFDRLSLLKKVAASDTFTRIDNLSELKIITKGSAERLKDWISLVLFMRLKTYSHYQAQKEVMNPLLKPFDFEDQDLVEKQFALDHGALKKIRKIYRIFISFYQAIKEFLAGNEEKLKSSALKDTSPMAEGDILRRLFQHKKAKKYYLLAKKTNSQNSEVLNALGSIYYEQGSLDKALNYISKALTIDLKLWGENHPGVARDYNNLGLIYQGQGNLGKATEYSSKALAIDLKLFGENHFTVARDYHTLGEIYQDQGYLDKAADYINKALAIDLKVFGENHFAVARDYLTLGEIYQDQGKLEKAVDYINQALGIDLKFFGKNHYTVARDYHNLGGIYQGQGNLEKAADYINKALTIDLKLFGENHHTVARDYHNLGEIYQDLGNLEKAADYINKALIISLKLFGENHPRVARDYSTLGAIYQDQGKLDKAAEYSTKALAIDRKVFGKNHPRVARDYNSQGALHYDQGNLEKAAEYNSKALAIDRRLFGENHPNVAIRYNNLALIHTEQGNFDKGADYSTKALAITLKLYGENHPKMASCYNNLGEVYREQGDLEKAAAYLNKALVITLKLYGENHLVVASCYNNLGQVYQEQGNLEKSVDYINKAFAITLKLYGENHPKVAIGYNNLGAIYKAQGNLEKAADYINKALAITLKLYGENHPKVATRYNNLALIHTEQGNLDKGVEYSKKALAITLKLYGENHPKMATRYNNLALIHTEQGNLEKAADYINKAVAITLKLYGENHPKVAICYINLGALYKKQGELDKAAENTRKSLAINLKLFGENHPSIAKNYNILGTIHYQQGNIEDTIYYVKKALAINLKLFSENHSIVAADYANLGQIYREQHDLKQAANYIKKSLAINLKLFGKNHLLVVRDNSNLGAIYKEQGKLDKAAEYIKKSLSINLKLWGENHLHLVTCYNNLAQLYHAQSKLDKAVKYSHKALIISLNLIGENHLQTAICYLNLGVIYQAQGYLGKAAKYAKKSLVINLKLFDENHFSVAKNYNILGGIYYQQGNMEKATYYTKKSLAVKLKLLGDNHPLVAIDYSNLGQIRKRARQAKKSGRV
ncbi:MULTISPECIES: tetratricopeptide repeat protein [unclassified Neochlamydia]|uniref:tetratricopeptide repeat protein n=1 Tax=unclassified Neochlamydia TaxID=2643326 RepID=UPI00140B525D|nr:MULTISPECIES: tetratricopeptide repeat protein [unclassified Neochlamydia]MBS4169408.1 Uncharacterized protein [Neochlamydia sp. AcF95]NGY95260.1 hypothetical protein [Neochlamydia sp. AcF84]